MINKRKRIITIVIMCLIVILIMIPIYLLIVTTFKPEAEAAQSPMSLPSELYVENYEKAFDAMNYPTALRNNIIVSGGAVVLVIVVSAMAGYVLARKVTRITKFMYVAFIAGLMIPFQTLIIPLYKIVSGLGMVNNLIGVIIIMAAMNIPFTVFLFAGFVKTLPYEVEEAAKIDGCGKFKMFWSIVFPMLKPVVATAAILTLLSTWNDFITPLLFLQSRENSVLVLEVFRNIGTFGTDYFSKMCIRDSA